MDTGKALPLMIIRGGTSKGIYVEEEHLPANPGQRDQALLALMGSPDPRQIDGLGGGDPLTSKAALLKRSVRPDADIDYTFAYVSVDKAQVDYAGNCGNISAGVGLFALAKGWVIPSEPLSKVRIFNTNSGKIIEALIPYQAGTPLGSGDFRIDGVPGRAARIELNFLDCGGAKTGQILPTGHPQNIISLADGRQIAVSIVDAATPAIFFKASDLGFSGTELPSADNCPQLLEIMEEIRGICAQILGFVKDKSQAASLSPALPKVIMVSPAQDYQDSSGRLLMADDIDLVARTKSLAVLHKAFAVTGGICTATAALIEGSVVNQVLSRAAKDKSIVRLGHPSGSLEFAISLRQDVEGNYDLDKAAVTRTARILMQGEAYI